MAPVSRTLPSLVGGVSQQAASLRRSSQVESQLNCYPSLVEGNKKRPPTEYVAKLQSGTLSDAFVHTIDRDPGERYKVVLTNGGLKVFDLNGVEKSVSFPDGTSYLSATTPSENFRLLTIADYTFVVNNTVTASMSSALSAVRGPEALVFVKQVELDYHYKVIIGTTEYDFQTHHETPPSAADIAEGLKDLMVAGGVTVTSDRSTLHITNASPFECRASGPNTDIDIRCFTKSAQNFTDLPTIAPAGYHIEVIGTQTNDFDNYYVKFVPNNSGASFDSGTWVETLAEGVTYALDAATMPHVLIRNGDGTFTFQKASWTDRKVGDNTTNSIPSFVGNKINDVVFHKGRLGFLADSNVILSESGKFFNFFRTTVTALLDTDPIDVAVNQVAILRSAIEFNKELLLCTDKQHFVLSGGDLLTPKSASTDPVTKFETTFLTEPVATDKAVYFAVPRANYAGIRELVIDPVSGRPDPQEVTAHVPKYIPGKITKIAVSQGNNFLLALADGDRTEAYAYNYYWNGDQKLQSAWGKWTFNGSTILSAEFLNSVLYLVIQRSDGVFLVKQDISTDRIDSDDVDHLTNLDMRVSELQCSAVSYNSTTDRTSWTLPYSVASGVTYQVVTRYASEDDVPGVVAEDVSVSGTTISCKGDFSTTPVYIGEQYRQEFVLSQQFVTVKDASGGDVIIPDAKLKLLFLTLVFEKTGYFKVQIDYAHRPDAPNVTEFQGRVIGSAENALENIALEDGKLRMRVGADSERCTITIINDSFLPANFQSLSIEGREIGRARTRA